MAKRKKPNVARAGPAPNDATPDRPHIALWPDTQSLIGDAEAGDHRARGRLYGQAGELLAAGAMPEPLRSFARDGLRNKAAKGARFSRGKKPGDVSDATRYLRALRRPGETVKELSKRIEEQPDPDAPVYINELRVMIDKSTGKEISIKSLEARLNLRKSQ